MVGEPVKEGGYLRLEVSPYGVEVVLVLESTMDDPVGGAAAFVFGDDVEGAKTGVALFLEAGLFLAAGLGVDLGLDLPDGSGELVCPDGSEEVIKGDANGVDEFQDRIAPGFF